MIYVAFPFRLARMLLCGACTDAEDINQTCRTNIDDMGYHCEFVA